MELLEKFNIETKNFEIYNQAFLHSSYCNENNISNNYERLEFLGDKVLDLIISEYLYRNTDYEEGTMTKYRAMYVCEDALYEYAFKLGFYDYIKVGKGEALSGGKYRKAILADTFEAFLAALYIDKGFDYVKSFIYKNIIPIIKNDNINFFIDYKSKLQELVQTSKNSVSYNVIKEEGPAHDKMFTVEVVINNIKLGSGTAHSKKEAEQIAAKTALEKQAKIE